VPKLDQTEVSPDQFILKRLDELTQSMNRLERAARFGRARPTEEIKFDSSLRALDLTVRPEFREILKSKLLRIMEEYPPFAWNMAGNKARVYVSDSTPPQVIYQLDQLRTIVDAKPAQQKDNGEPPSEI
jgi:hypothetical protein